MSELNWILRGIYAVTRTAIYLAGALLVPSPVSADIGIGFAKFDEGEVCPSNEKFDCAPTNDPRIKLDDSPILESEDGEIWSYIGGLKFDRSGSVPARCISSDIPPELLVANKLSTFSIEYNTGKTRRFGLGLDMIGALKEAGASDQLLENASAGISAAYERIGNGKVTTQAEYWVYKLRNSEISALKGIGSNEIFSACLKAVPTNEDNGLVVALGGFWIRESLASERTTKELTLGVTAALRAAGASEEELASLSGAILSSSERVVSSELRDVFEGRAMNYLNTSSIYNFGG